MKNCLVVDDSKVIRKVARHILESLDITVSEACDGREALSQCQSGSHDVVLLDWNMPEMTGIEMLRAIRDHEQLKSIPVLMVTAEAQQHNLVEAVQAGVSNYIVKPFTAETMQEKLAKIWRDGPAWVPSWAQKTSRPSWYETGKPVHPSPILKSFALPRGACVKRSASLPFTPCLPPTAWQVLSPLKMSRASWR